MAGQRQSFLATSQFNGRKSVMFIINYGTEAVNKASSHLRAANMRKWNDPFLSVPYPPSRASTRHANGESWIATAAAMLMDGKHKMTFRHGIYIGCEKMTLSLFSFRGFFAAKNAKLFSNDKERRCKLWNAKRLPFATIQTSALFSCSFRCEFKQIQNGTKFCETRTRNWRRKNGFVPDFWMRHNKLSRLIYVYCA